MGVDASDKFLDDQTVRFCQPNEYNDPFELTPEIRLTEELSLPSKNLGIYLAGGKPQFEKYEILESELSNYRYHLNSNLVAEVSKLVGCTCFSYSEASLPVNLLMWAHYAESHKGIAIQLKESSALIQDMSPVVYRKKRPILNGKYLSENEVIFIRDLYVKSEHWEYESEHRLSRKFEDCSEVSNGIFVSKISPSDVERIVLGVNASKELREKALNFHKQYNVQVILTKRASSDFGFEPFTVFGAEYSDAVSITEWYRYESAQR